MFKYKVVAPLSLADKFTNLANELRIEICDSKIDFKNKEIIFWLNVSPESLKKFESHISGNLDLNVAPATRGKERR